MSNSYRSPKANITENFPTPFIEYKPEPKYWLRRAIAVGLVATAAVGVAKGHEYITAPKSQVVYGGEIVTEVAQDPSDTVWAFANKIKGVGSTVTTAEAVDYLESINPGLADGLSQGEAIERPSNVQIVEPSDGKE